MNPNPNPTLPLPAAAPRSMPKPGTAPALDFQPKPVSSARSGMHTLPDGRLRCWIEHQRLQGITPKMLLWWFQHLEGEMDFQGQRLPRYRVWHPRDHVKLRYRRRCADGSIGVGAQIALTELLGANPRYRVNITTDIVRLDEGGFGHRPRLHGLRAAAMDYSFEAVPGGTLYKNSLVIGFSGRWARPLNGLLQRWFFDDAHGRAWIRHNIEEVGQFEQFLPGLYVAEA
jgi:DAPG hydrolase PhiG domain